jgi:hypothetical protein
VSRGYPWWIEPASVLGALLVRALGATWRVDRDGLGRWDAEVAAGARCIYAFWHARLLPLVYTHRGLGIVVLVSRHRDGQLVTRIIERLGFGSARGSSTRGGEEGARAMLSRAADRRLLGIAPDGPRGPAGRLKPGLVWLASRTGLPVVPVAGAARRCWRLRSWDRMRIPKPFERVVVAYGEPIRVPPDLARDEVEAWRVRIEAALHEHTRAVAARAGEAA